MKPILVHCHIYYPEMWAELKSCIMNIRPYCFELFVTMIEEHKSVIDDVKANFVTANIEIVPNKGYDIAPFVHVVNHVNLDEYSYVVKVHTKRDMPFGSRLNYFDLSGDKWRKYLLDMLSTSLKFQRCIKAFEEDSALGMVSNYRLIFRNEPGDVEAEKVVIELLNKHGYRNISYVFVAGSMFVARAKLFEPLQKMGFDINDFAVPNKEHSSSLAHACERLLGCLVLAQKHKIKDVLSGKIRTDEISYFCQRLWGIVGRFIYQSKITKKGNKIVKVCKIPVYRRG